MRKNDLMSDVPDVCKANAEIGGKSQGGADRAAGQILLDLSCYSK